MSIALTNMPFYCLLWITFGVILVVIAIFMVAGQLNEQNKKEDKVHKEMPHSKQEIEELFNYFLQEEEKKNEDLRALLSKSQEEKNYYAKMHAPKQRPVDQSVKQIIELHEAGEEAEAIAKKLKKGVGEVKLVISLYTKSI